MTASARGREAGDLGDAARPYAVCVYCASGSADPELLELADSTGAGIAGRGWTLVSGGGSVSMMGRMVTSARAHGGRTIGVIPGALVDREVADIDSDELVVVETMRERKQVMDDSADAFLALPGGIGTLEELFEAWTSATLRFHTRPVVVLNHEGFYDPLLSWLDRLVDDGMVKPGALEMLRVTATLDEALDICGGHG